MTAREVVVLGTVQGNMEASERVDVRSDGPLTGDRMVPHITAEEGAIVHWGIDIHRPGNGQDKGPETAHPSQGVTPKLHFLSGQPGWEPVPM
jgi:cytoskeletal protein CcmA (bactofilin family)